jgi:hypothetical protein
VTVETRKRDGVAVGIDGGRCPRVYSCSSAERKPRSRNGTVWSTVPVSALRFRAVADPLARSRPLRFEMVQRHLLRRMAAGVVSSGMANLNTKLELGKIDPGRPHSNQDRSPRRSAITYCGVPPEVNAQDPYLTSPSITSPAPALQRMPSSEHDRVY